MAWIVLWAGGCRSHPPVDPMPRVVTDSDELADQLREAVRTWEGTPHRLGGNDRRGIDCSGLVVQLYRDLFGYRLPRTTSALSKTGRAIDPGQLLPGDLVFFHLPDGKRHVGIYLDRGQFAHASTRRGVMISGLQEPYWQEAFWTARRLLS
jgi:probable lipoprotein NlpC